MFVCIQMHASCDQVSIELLDWGGVGGKVVSDLDDCTGHYS